MITGLAVAAFNNAGAQWRPNISATTFGGHRGVGSRFSYISDWVRR